MINRVNIPLGWACVAGHIEKGESPEEALKCEVKEEVNLDLKKFNLLITEDVPWNNCKKHKGHNWQVYEALEWIGEEKINKKEMFDMKWVKINELKKLKLEKVWKYWFKKLKIV